VIKAGAHAAWIVPAVQVIGAAPALAVSNCRNSRPIAQALEFSVSQEWVRQTDAKGVVSFYLRLTFTVCDRNCDTDLTNLRVSVTATNAPGGLQEHSTTNQAENPGTLWVPSGGSGSTELYTSSYVVPKGTCMAITSAIQVRAQDGNGKFDGKLTITMSSAEGATVTTTVNVAK
jgi:hypothetical protein